MLLLAKGIAFEPWRLRVPSHPTPGQGEHVIFLVGAVNHLAERGFRGNVFVTYDWGSYVMWKLGHGVQISLDSRYDVAYPAWRLEEDHAFFERPARVGKRSSRNTRPASCWSRTACRSRPN